jgi:hypothetical protein
MVAVEERVMVLQKRINMGYQSLASNDVPGTGAGQ